MLSRLRQFFEDAVDAAGESEDPEAAVRRAGAALLVEMTRADSNITEQEHAQVARALESVFGLSGSDADALLEAAHDDAVSATSLYEFTSVLNERFGHDQKVALVDQLWQVAYADGELNMHEAHLVRKVAELLHLRHHEYIGGKLRAGG